MLSALLSLLLITQANASVQLLYPYPLRSPRDPDVQESLKDYDLSLPLRSDGSNFPCKLAQNNNTNPQAYDVKAAYQAGNTYNISLLGNATYSGGSCQISLSYDNGATFKVIHSIIGGCPLNSNYNFTVPSFAPSSNTVLLSWSWFPLIGNRDMYQNCARVQVQGTPSQRIRRGARTYNFKRQNSMDELPDMFACNVGNGCRTVERREVVFPNPGPSSENGTNAVTPDPGPGFVIDASNSTNSSTTTSQTLASTTTSSDISSTTDASATSSSDVASSSTTVDVGSTTISPTSESTSSQPPTTVSTESSITLSSATDSSSSQTTIDPATTSASNSSTTESSTTTASSFTFTNSSSSSTVTDSGNATSTTATTTSISETTTITSSTESSTVTSTTDTSPTPSSTLSTTASISSSTSSLTTTTTSSSGSTTVTSTISISTITTTVTTTVTSTATTTVTTTVTVTATDPSASATASTSSLSTTVTTVTSTVSGTATATPTSTPPVLSGPCTPGQFACNSPTSFSQCVSMSSGSTFYVYMGNVAAGTECVNGQIVRQNEGACATDGELVCNGTGAFYICDHGGLVNMGSVAAGTKCDNGEIIAA